MPRLPRTIEARVSSQFGSADTGKTPFGRQWKAKGKLIRFNKSGIMMPRDVIGWLSDGSNWLIPESYKQFFQFFFTLLVSWSGWSGGYLTVFNWYSIVFLVCLALLHTPPHLESWNLIILIAFQCIYSVNCEPWCFLSGMIGFTAVGCGHICFFDKSCKWKAMKWFSTSKEWYCLSMRW